MAEYGREQRGQMSRVITNSRSGSKQLKRIISTKAQVMQGFIIQREPSGDVTFDQILNLEAHPVVKKTVCDLPKHKLASLVKASQDNPVAFKEAIKSPDTFSGSHGWYPFVSSIPNQAMAIYRVKDLAKKGKLMPTGRATWKQLGEIHAFTQHGDMINVPLRYQPTWMGDELKVRHKTLVDGMSTLSSAPERSAAGEIVYSGKAFSVADFQSKIKGKTGSKAPLLGMVSSTSKLETAEGFVKLTEKWAGAGTSKPVGVIFRIHSTFGVHIDDLSEWGRHMGREVHWDASSAVQVQDEVLMNQGDFIQISEPVKYKMIDGVQYYFVDCEEPKRKKDGMPAHAIAPRAVTSSAPSNSRRVRFSSHGTMASEGIRPTIPFSQESERHKSSFHIPGRPAWKF